MVTPSAEYLEMLAEDSYDTLIKSLKSHKNSIEAVEKYATAIQAEINKREAAKREQEKAQADLKRKEAHKDSIWASLKSYGDKYGEHELSDQFGADIYRKCYPDKWVWFKIKDKQHENKADNSGIVQCKTYTGNDGSEVRVVWPIKDINWYRYW
jgi:hypothetical protein